MDLFSRRKSWREAIFPLLILFALNLIFFFSFIFLGKVFFQFDTLGDDPLFQQSTEKRISNIEAGDIPVLLYPPMRSYNHMLHRGKIPFWDPSIMGGYPFISNFDLPYLFYPPALFLHRFFQTIRAANIFLFLHVLLSGVSMYFLARHYGLPRSSSLFSSIVWMFSGQATTWLEYSYLTPVYAWMPLIFLCYRVAIERRSFAWAVSGGVCAGLMLLGGHAQFNYYVFIFLTVYALYRILGARGDWRRIAGFFLVIVVLGFLIGAPILLSQMELAAFSHRRVFTYDEVLSDYSAPLSSYLARLFFPDILGNPSQGLHINLRGTTFYHEICVYAGIIPLLLAICGIGRSRKESPFYAGTALFSLLIASSTILYYPFHLLVPAFNKLLPSRITIMFFFSISILAGFGFSRLKEEKQNMGLLSFFAGGILLLNAILFIFTMALQSHPELFQSLFRFLLPLTRFNFAESPTESHAIQFLRSILMYYNPGNLTLFLPGIFCLLTLLIIALEKRQYINGQIFLALFFLLSAADLLGFGLRFLPVTGSLSPAAPQAVKILTSLKGKEPFRLLRLGDKKYPNVMGIFDIEEIEGRRNLSSRDFIEIMGEIESRFNGSNRIIFGNNVSLSSYDSPVLDMLNVKYVLSYHRPLPESQSLSFIEKTGNLFLYEKKSACSRFYFTPQYEIKKLPEIKRLLLSQDFNPSISSYIEKKPIFTGAPGECDTFKCAIRELDCDRITIDVETPEDGILVFSDIYFPGWRVKINEQEADLLRVNALLKGVALVGGAHRVSFTFEPRYLRTGFILEFISLLAVLSYAIFLITSREKRKNAKIIMPNSL